MLLRFTPGYQSLIVIENFKYQGYKTISPCTKLSMSFLYSILSSLATVHAAGLILKKRTPVCLSSFYPCLMDIELIVKWKKEKFIRGCQSVSGNVHIANHLSAHIIN